MNLYQNKTGWNHSVSHVILVHLSVLISCVKRWRWNWCKMPTEKSSHSLSHCWSGLTTETWKKKWWICDPLWWLVRHCFISPLSGWDCKSLSLMQGHLITCSPWMWVVKSQVSLIMPFLRYGNGAQVIYAGMVFASEGADLTIWLLFAFVVLFLVPESWHLKYL